MPTSDCCECDNPAACFHGPYAYCGRHLRDARDEDPLAHSCPSCGVTQPKDVLWRGEPCGLCKRYPTEKIDR